MSISAYSSDIIDSVWSFSSHTYYVIAIFQCKDAEKEILRVENIDIQVFLNTCPESFILSPELQNYLTDILKLNEEGIKILSAYDLYSNKPVQITDDHFISIASIVNDDVKFDDIQHFTYLMHFWDNLCGIKSYYTFNCLNNIYSTEYMHFGNSTLFSKILDNFTCPRKIDVITKIKGKLDVSDMNDTVKTCNKRYPAKDECHKIEYMVLGKKYTCQQLVSLYQKYKD